MDHEELRLKAMEMAQREGHQPDLIGRSEEIYQWLRYGRDGAADVRKALAGLSPDLRERMEERIKLMTVRGDALPARVVGKDSDIIDRLRKEDGYEHE